MRSVTFNLLSRLSSNCAAGARRILGTLRLWSVLVCLALVSSAQPGPQRDRIMPVSYGDWVESGDLFSSKEAIEQSFRFIKESGATDIYWRMLWEGHPIDRMVFFGNNLQARNWRLKQAFEGTPYAWNPHELAYPIEAAHKLGMKFYAWIVLYNEGAPPQAAGEYWYQSLFTYERPEYLAVDRTGRRRNYGILEFAYPQARQYWVDEVQEILDKYPVDGIHIDTRTESPCPLWADEFGFNEPVVQEYLRRYGVDILKEDFDLEKWRSLRGEYLTLLLKEIAQRVHAQGGKLSLATSRGDYIGYPIGNIKLEWRKWMQERIIDSLYLDEHGWCWGPNRPASPGVLPSDVEAIQPYGFMTDWPTERGLKPLDAAIREDYSPLARKHGVKLYFRCYPYKARPTSKECCDHRATSTPKPLPEGWCQRMAAMPEFDGIVEVAPYFLKEKLPDLASRPRREQRRPWPVYK